MRVCILFEWETTHTGTDAATSLRTEAFRHRIGSKRTIVRALCASNPDPSSQGQDPSDHALLNVRQLNTRCTEAGAENVWNSQERMRM